MRKQFWKLAAIAAAMTAAPAAAQTQFTGGHGDIGIWSTGSGYELKLSSGTAWQVEPESATIVVGSHAQTNMPTGLQPGMTTTASHLWKLPQSATEAATKNLPYLGVQVHGGSFTTPGTLPGTLPSTTSPTTTDPHSSTHLDDVCGPGPSIHLHLQSVVGPGGFSMWQDVEADALGLGGPGGPGFENRPDLLATPGAAMSSGDGVGHGDYICAWPGMHTHMNWGFTQPGNYAVTFLLHGDTGSGEFEDTATYNFAVQTPMAAFGDLDHSGTVTQNDLALFASHFGTVAGASTATGDFNGDGAVGLADMLILRNNLASISNLGGGNMSASAVPEPSTYALAAMGAAGLLYLRRRKARAVN